MQMSPDRKDLIAKAILGSLKGKKLKLKQEDISSRIEIPPSLELGDFAFPCFFLSSLLKQNPNEIAIEIREKLGNQKGFSDIQTKGSYINFFVDRNEMASETISKVLNEKEKFGSMDLGKGENVLIEHTSINPNASPHVGRARNAIIGDSIVKILKFMGFSTEVHYFVNDVSKQIAMLVLAGAEKLKFEKMLSEYVKIAAKVKKFPATEKKVFDLLYGFEGGDRAISDKFMAITKTCVEGQKKILSELGINYDVFDYESSYLDRTKDILKELEKTRKLFTDEDGRKVLDLKGTSVEGQMKSPVLVLTRSDGTGLYPLRDIAYTLDKMKRSESNIIVLGEDQKLYFQQVSEALKLLGSPSPQVVHYSFILLSKGGRSKKMATRKGDVVLLEDFLREAVEKAAKKSKKKSYGPKIGIGAVKYSILRNSPNKVINFNLDEALNFEGDTGPYLLYSYARANSILEKTSVRESPNSKTDLEEKETELVKKISEFPSVVSRSYDSLNPSHIANYAYQLAQTFNEFYHSCLVVKSENESFRLALVKSFMQVLKNSLNLLGIETLDKM